MELEKQVASHEARITNLEQAHKELSENYREAIRMFHDLNARTDARIREVKEDLRAEIGRIEEKLNTRLDKFEEKMDAAHAKMDEALEKVRQSVPAWVGPLIGVLIAACGWLVSFALRN